MPIVVTGAAGFIGSRLAHAFAAKEQDLVLVDHPMVPGKAGNLSGLEQFPFLDHETFLDQFDRDPGAFEGVFHMGACSSTVETSWEYLLKNNLEYSERLWKGCAQAGTRLIYASSAATYGDRIAKIVAARLPGTL